jgi:tetratricopeptide (TPR) repeat protein
LEHELRLKTIVIQDQAETIKFLQTHITALQGSVTPSPAAREIATLIPKDAGAYALGLKATAECRFEDARRHLQEASKKPEADIFRIYTARARIDFYAGRFEDALTWYEKALHLRTDDPEVLEELAKTYGAVGRLHDAERVINQIILIRTSALGEAAPDLASALVLRGSLRAMMGKYTNSKEDCENALRILKKAEGNINKATDALMCLTAVDNFGGDHGTSDEVLELAYRNLLRASEDGDADADKRLARYSPLFLLKATSDPRMAKFISRITAQVEDALAGGNICLLTDFGHVAVQKYFGSNEFDKLQLLSNRSISILVKSIGEHNPYLLPYYFGLAAVYSRSGRQDKMEETLSAAIQTTDRSFKNGYNSALLLFSIGAIYMGHRTYDKAEPVLERGLKNLRFETEQDERSPLLQAYLKALSDVYTARGKGEQATVLMEEANSLNGERAPFGRRITPDWVKDGPTIFLKTARSGFYETGSVTGVRNEPLAWDTADRRAKSAMLGTFKAYIAYIMEQYQVAQGSQAVPERDNKATTDTNSTLEEFLRTRIQVAERFKDETKNQYYVLTKLSMQDIDSFWAETGDLDKGLREFYLGNALSLYDRFKKLK